MKQLLWRMLEVRQHLVIWIASFLLSSAPIGGAQELKPEPTIEDVTGVKDFAKLVKESRRWWVCNFADNQADPGPFSVDGLVMNRLALLDKDLAKILVSELTNPKSFRSIALQGPEAAENIKDLRVLCLATPKGVVAIWWNRSNDEMWFRLADGQGTRRVVIASKALDQLLGHADEILAGEQRDFKKIEKAEGDEK
jgi:hypothetical protein